MAHSVSTIDDASGATGTGAPASEDDWRTGGLPAQRAELDRIDDTIHDLLMRRAGVVEHVARSGKPAAFRPGREASIIRRLLRRHAGALPPVALTRIWRELLAGTTSMQGAFSLAVYEPVPGAPMTQLAREHFGALTPLQPYASPGQALTDLSRGGASVAVLPYPTDTDNWWVSLMHHEPRLFVIGRLPFWTRRPEGAVGMQAVVIASTPPDDSEDDRSILGFECDSEVSRTRLANEVSAAGFVVEAMVMGRRQGLPVANVWVDVAGHLADDDARLARLGVVLRRPVVLGGYAAPVGAGA